MTTTKEERTWGMICHLSALIAYLTVVPLGTIIAPLVVWLWKKEESSFIDYNGKESINFQISFLIYVLVASLLCFILIGFIILPILYVWGIICTVLATVQAKKGEEYRYPLTIRFLR
ncbi:DUF4870 domain-containing protein [Mechercharimyces sp. CAU 1602]|uniref:DUF4870 domain-containing protein n=1 Tax=Mechercharimyces sp. CAU 1602 TaxID=2973933 RepID=UPI00216360CA|nr:DUF4870 domain-containing protein [Mechercharimyces sp. CAU 1602]MCS1351734.1 DUF4870 domain-containing protein [Mechercharimyces sp. CAU 1602]